MLEFLQSRPHPAITQPISTAQQAWNQDADRLNSNTLEQLQSWHDEASDPEAPEERWDSLKIALDSTALS
jgi:hypothetical protein